ncbi:MAG: bacteriohemerythrin [Trichlorobacter sp.]|jgi:hemerythrin-like metal-binding protein|nr:bacteriohemerythrin [Trichlorobacter sp.]
MSHIAWKAEYSVGNSKLDQHHQRIVNMINLLGDAIDNGSEKAALMKIFSDLAGYTKTHFAEEERLMTQAAYPAVEEHCLQHAELNRKLADYYRSFYAGTRPKSDEVMQFLQGWLFDHILEQDMAYAPLLKD